ncbi:hypothetical protein C5471_11370 [Photorhabdus tasmaniensis]|uniref:Uncharacterized protein n=1 Tax=Photorhabdus tasmaniensis TaxID=1004159 RepID=A0ABX0GIR4_9GAMM|nr:hypothetical protein [Photorhabdus tasmaniensis]
MGLIIGVTITSMAISSYYFPKTGFFNLIKVIIQVLCEYFSMAVILAKMLGSAGGLCDMLARLVKSM